MYVTFSEHTYTTYEGDPEDRWDRGSTASDVEITGIRHSRSGRGYDCQKVDPVVKGLDGSNIPPGEMAFVVWAHYQTGDAFGSDDAWCVVAVVPTIEEATLLQAQAEDGTLPGERYMTPWEGYFKHLLSINLGQLLMQR